MQRNLSSVIAWIYPGTTYAKCKTHYPITTVLWTGDGILLNKVLAYPLNRKVISWCPYIWMCSIKFSGSQNYFFKLNNWGDIVKFTPSSQNVNGIIFLSHSILIYAEFSIKGKLDFSFIFYCIYFFHKLMISSFLQNGDTQAGKITTTDTWTCCPDLKKYALFCQLELIPPP